MKPSNTKPKFQFSMKTLMLGITVAAILSAVGSWLGLWASIIALLLTLQVAVVGGCFTWIVLRILRNFTAETGRQIVVPVLFAVLIYSVIMSPDRAYRKVFNNYLWHSGFDIYLIRACISWLSLTVKYYLEAFLLLSFLLLPLFVIELLFQKLAKHLNRLDARFSYIGVSLIGLVIGCCLFAVGMSHGATKYPAILLFTVLPVVVLTCVPPGILAWADKLGPKKPNHQMLPQEPIP